MKKYLRIVAGVLLVLTFVVGCGYVGEQTKYLNREEQLVFQAEYQGMTAEEFVRKYTEAKSPEEINWAWEKISKSYKNPELNGVKLKNSLDIRGLQTITIPVITIQDLEEETVKESLSQLKEVPED